MVRNAYAWYFLSDSRISNDYGIVYHAGFVVTMRLIESIMFLGILNGAYGTSKTVADPDDSHGLIYARLVFSFSPNMAGFTTPLFTHIADLLNLNLANVRTVASAEVKWMVSDNPNSETINGAEYTLQYLTRTGSSAIWLARKAHPSIQVIKYTNNCVHMEKYKSVCNSKPVSSNFESVPKQANIRPESADPICRPENADLDPLVDEFVIMKVLGSLAHAVVPQAYELTPIKLFDTATPAYVQKILGKPVEDPLQSKDLAFWSRCTPLEAGYRGLLEEYVGPDMIEVFGTKIESLDPTSYFRQVLMMGRRIVGVMWRSHDLGLVHGDFHDGNSAFKFKKSARSSTDYDPFEDEVVLIDFGYSRFTRGSIIEP